MCAVLHAVSHVQHLFCSKKLCSCDCYYECLVCCIGYCLRYVPVSLIFLCHTEVAWSGVGQLIFAVATLLIVLNEALSRGLIGI